MDKGRIIVSIYVGMVKCAWQAARASCLLMIRFLTLMGIGYSPLGGVG